MHTRLSGAVHHLHSLDGNDHLLLFCLLFLPHFDRLSIGFLQDLSSLESKLIISQISLLLLLWKSLAFYRGLLDDEGLGGILIEIFNDRLLFDHKACDVLVGLDVSGGCLGLLRAN